MGQFIATVEQDRILDPVARVARNIALSLNPVLYPGTGSAIAISQEELALLAGLSRASVNKALQQLEGEGLVQIEPGRIVASDIDALASYDLDVL